MFSGYEDILASSVSQCGCKILGSFVGSDSYITQSLATYLHQWNSDADKLISYSDFQGRYLLFVKSFLLRPNHLFRTIHPKHFLNLLSQFEYVKKKVIASLLDLHVTALSDYIYHTRMNE